MAETKGGSEEHVLLRLVTAYEQGLLVPFMGAGVSAHACPLWGDFVANLEDAAAHLPKHASTAKGSKGEAESPKDPSAAELIRRANDAVRTLRNFSEESFAKYVRQALQYAKNTDAAQSMETPALTSTLAKIWWPLLLTTNYDDWFYHAYTGHKAAQDNKRRLDVVGRSPQDCQKVLYSLGAPRDSIL